MAFLCVLQTRKFGGEIGIGFARLTYVLIQVVLDLYNADICLNNSLPPKGFFDLKLSESSLLAVPA